MSRIGLQMYTVREQIKTPEALNETLKKLAEIGIEHLQMSVPAYTTADEIAVKLKEYHMTADSGYMPTGESAEKFEKAKHEAEVFGSDVIRTNSIPASMRADADGYKRFAEQLNYEGGLCKASGLRYIYHFHAFEFVNFGNIRGIDILLNETDKDKVFFQPDVFWLTNAGTEPSVSLKMFGGRAFWIHVKDYAIMQLSGIIESVPYCFAPVGEGNLNWNGILKTADEMGIERYVIEQDMTQIDVFESIKISVDNLHKMGIR